jgi:undecaprenyl-diphosphatase
MTSRISRKPLIAAAGFAVALLVLTWWVNSQGPIPGDQRAYEAALDHAAAPNEETSNLYQFFAGMGSLYVAAATTLAGALIVLRNVGAAAAVFVIAAAGALLLDRALAEVVGPTQAAAEVIFPPGGFPSGHATYATAVFGAFAVLGARHGRPEVTLVSATLIVLMGITRVADRSHLPDEVLGGYLLGAAWLCLLVAYRPLWGRS